MMQEAVRQWLEALEPALREAADAERSQAEKAYLKIDLEVIGTGMPFVRDTTKRFRREFPKLERAELVEVVRTLWQPPVYELRSLAIALLEAYRKRLLPEDLPLVETLLHQSQTWAHVDWLSVKVAGDLIERSPEREQVLERWSRDPNFWLRRSALLAHLQSLREGKGDFESFSRLAVGMLEEKEFFIRKAIGWILREVSRKRPELTYAFLDAHLERVSGLTLREGARHLPEARRDALMARYAALAGGKRTKAGSRSGGR